MTPRRCAPFAALVSGLCLSLFACQGSGGKDAPSDPSTAPSGAEGAAEAAATAGEKAAVEGEESKGEPMGFTGVLSEAEFAKLHELSATEAPAARGEVIDLDGSIAYLSLPEGNAPYPAVVVIHEWWGLNSHMKHWTDRLAADGYAALAVDLYGGKTATTPDEAMAMVKAVDEARANQILAKAVAFLKDDARVQASARGVVGWCFGGGWSLQTAMKVDGLDAAVIYYGRLVDDPQALASIEAPVLGIFGNHDEGIPPASVDAFEAAMKSADRKLTVLRFDAGHGFANPSSARYDATSAEAAWAKVRSFLADNLRGAGTGGGEGGGGGGAGAEGGCTVDADCGEGMLCEGEGCDPGQGLCVPKARACTRDLRPYCGCDGKTFRSSGSCPGARFAHKGPCEGDAG